MHRISWNTVWNGLLPAFLLLTGCSAQADHEPTGTARAPVPVRTAEVVREAIAQPVRATGTLAARDEAQLSFKIGGVVDRILVDEGSRVRRGQTLATLNPREIDAQVRQAEQAADKALRDLRRAEALYADSVVTLAQLQDARTRHEVALSELEIARFNQRYATITAPFDGVVLERQVEENELVGPGTPVLQVAGTGRGWVVRVGLSDRDVVRLRTGDSASVTFDAYPEAAYTGRVTEIAAAASPRTGTYEVEIALEGALQGLLSGLVARVEIRPGIAETATLVPIEALVEADGNEGVVFTPVADGRSVRRVPVEVLFLADDRVAVRGDLDTVQTVVTSGVAYLRDGASVTMTDLMEHER